MIRLGPSEYAILPGDLKDRLATWLAGHSFTPDMVQEACLGDRLASVVILLTTPEGDHYVRSDGQVATQTIVFSAPPGELVEAIGAWLGEP